MHSLGKADRVLREHGQRNATRHKRNKRIMKMLILIIVIFSLGWIPLGYVFCLLRAGYEICHRIFLTLFTSAVALSHQF